MGRLLCMQNNEGKVTKCGRFRAEQSLRYRLLHTLDSQSSLNMDNLQLSTDNWEKKNIFVCGCVTQGC